MLKIIAGLLLFTYSFSTNAQNQPNTILWEVSKPGTTYKSYLFGTFHEVNPAFFQSLKNSVQKLNTASVLFVEQAKSDFDGSLVNNDDLLNWNAEKWNKRLAADQRKVFRLFVEKSEDTGFYKMPPLVLSLALYRLYAQNFCDISGRDSNKLLDHYIEELAAAQNKQIISLDEKGSLTTAFAPSSNAIPDSVNVVTCITLMRKMLADDASECQIINDYRNFNLRYEFEREITKQNSNLDLLQRNKSWVLKLDKAFKQNNCFVAVGFRHLMYKQGLIQQFKDLGYTVKPIPTQ